MIPPFNERAVTRLIQNDPVPRMPERKPTVDPPSNAEVQMRAMIDRKLVGTACLAVIGIAGALAVAQEKLGPQQPWSKYHVHDMKRPAPPIVTPGEQPGQPPSDAIVLFDGKSLDNWTNGSRRGAAGPMTWKIENGVMVSGKNSIFSKQQFGDAQVHVEW